VVEGWKRYVEVCCDSSQQGMSSSGVQGRPRLLLPKRRIMRSGLASSER
jgi:hypothetical protein